MNEAKLKAITGLLNSFPQTAGDIDALLKIMLAVLDDVSDAAVRNSAIRFAKGDVHGQELRFAPTPAEFRKMVELGFKQCLREDCRIWGVYPTSNPLHMRNRVYVGLTYIVAAFFGMVPASTERTIAE
jgi:hypothetical protein